MGTVSPRLDTVADDAAVIVENEGGTGRFLILCDHAVNRIPKRWGTLGLSAAQLKAHIAWDPGALGVARELARLLDSPLIYPTLSRLVIDCNRPLDAPDLIAPVSETTPIPGNAHIDTAERDARIAASYEPYHARIDAVLARRGRSALVAVHTYTPVYKGHARPWHAGVIFNSDRRLADPLIAALSAEGGLVIGSNEPYSPADRVYYTLERHGEAKGLPCVMIEIRNDQVRSAGAQCAWAARLAGHLAGAPGQIKKEELPPRLSQGSE